MKKSITAAALGCALIATPAFAADLPARSAAPVSPIFTPAPVYSWGGFYAGLDLGYAWQSANSTHGFVSSNVTPNGVIGGGYLGYNYQVAPSFILGVEGDIEGGAVKQSRNILGLATLGILGGGSAGATTCPSPTISALRCARAPACRSTAP